MNTPLKFSKLSGLVIVALYLSFGATHAIGSCQGNPSPNCGGPYLYIENYTQYTFHFDDVNWQSPELPLNVVGYSENFDVYPGKSETKQYKLQLKWPEIDEHYHFGSLKKGGYFTIHHPDWKGEVRVDFEKGKEEYKGSFIPFPRDTSKCYFSRITWEVKWATNGWKVTLKECLLDTGKIGCPEPPNACN